MIAAFATPHGMACVACVLARHGSLTVHGRHGRRIACDHRGTPLRQQGRTLTAVTIRHLHAGQRCSVCRQVVKRTPRIRIVHRLAVLVASLHHRLPPAPVRPPERGGVVHGVTATNPSIHEAGRPATRPVGEAA